MNAYEALEALKAVLGNFADSTADAISELATEIEEYKKEEEAIREKEHGIAPRVMHAHIDRVAALPFAIMFLSTVRRSAPP